MLPEKDISLEAEQITGITVEFNTGGEKVMKYNGTLVTALPCDNVLQDFVTWLKGQGGTVILAAHNVRSFDSKVLVSALDQAGLLTEFRTVVGAFSDTLKMFRDKLPDRHTYSEQSLVADILQTPYEAHNAVGDVSALTQLLCKVGLTATDMVKYSFLPIETYYQEKFRIQKSRNFPSFSGLIAAGVLKPNMAENIAGSGLSVDHLRLIYKRKDIDGLRDVLSAKNCENRPRVTDQKKTLDNLVPSLAKYFGDK